MLTNFNTYENIRKPKIERKNYTTIDQWFDLIKFSQYSDSIRSARNFTKEDNFYKAIKNILPAITYNFTFKDNKENKNINEATGLLYFDIDVEGFDIETLNKDAIYAYYKSFGGRGYSILVKVEGLTLENYNSTYEYICNSLDIEFVYDNGAKKATQFNVLSYDPDIYINKDSYIFNSIEPEEIELTSEEVEERENTISLNAGYDAGARYDNLDEIKFSGDYHINWDGYTYVRCWIPIVKMGNNDNNYLFSFTKTFVWLNPKFNEKAVFTIMKRVAGNAYLQTPSDARIIRDIKSVFKYKKAGTLQPSVYKRKRKFLFNKDLNLNKSEKFKIILKELGKKKSTDSKNKIQSAIENWNFVFYGKITTRAVIKLSGMGNNTVNKYWSAFKDQVEELNNNYKASIKPLKKQKTKKQETIMETEKHPQTALNTVITNDAPLVHVKPMIETSTYTFIGDFDVEMEGINIWNNLIADLTFDEKMDAETEIVKKLIEKSVATYELNVVGKTVKVFSNRTIEPNFIQVTLIEEEAIISPVMKDNNILDEVIIEQEIIEQEYSDECLEDIFTAEEIIQLEAMFKN